MISRESDIQSSCRKIEYQSITGSLEILSVLVIMIVLAWINDLHAQEPDKSDAWTAFVPPPDEYDWVQLTSGEWLISV